MGPAKYLMAVTEDAQAQAAGEAITVERRVHTVLAKVSVAKHLKPFDDDDDRCLLETGGIQEHEQPWSVTQPPQTNAQACRCTSGAACGCGHW